MCFTEPPSDFAAVGSRYVAPVARPEIGPAPPLGRKGRYQLVECQIPFGHKPTNYTIKTYIYIFIWVLQLETLYKHRWLMVNLGCMDTVNCICFIYFSCQEHSYRYCNITPKAKSGKWGIVFVFGFTRFVVLLSCHPSFGINFSAHSTSDVCVDCMP